MPAESVAQRRAMAIAKHHPEKLYARNRAMLKMTKSQLHEYASTKEAHLPQKARRKAMLIADRAGRS